MISWFSVIRKNIILSRSRKTYLFAGRTGCIWRGQIDCNRVWENGGQYKYVKGSDLKNGLLNVIMSQSDSEKNEDRVCFYKIGVNISLRFALWPASHSSAMILKSFLKWAERSAACSRTLFLLFLQGILDFQLTILCFEASLYSYYPHILS